MYLYLFTSYESQVCHYQSVAVEILDVVSFSSCSKMSLIRRNISYLYIYRKYQYSFVKISMVSSARISFERLEQQQGQRKEKKKIREIMYLEDFPSSFS